MNFSQINESLPILKLEHPVQLAHYIDLNVLRLDKTHPEISGNKWFKLKYNLNEARALGCETLLTFGGAFSNHIYAVASAGKIFGFKTIGIIRGEAHETLNATLKHAQNCGMQLKYMDRTTYRRKNEPEVIDQLKAEFGECYVLPEGGTNILAIQGASEILNSAKESFDYYCIPVGTGGTMAGIISSLNNTGKVLGFSALKGDFLKEEVKMLLTDYCDNKFHNWSINTEYHFGGYAKSSPELIRFIKEMDTELDLLLEPIYTAKMVYGVLDLIKKGHFPQGSKVLMMHTGGLQGRAGFGL